jgi:hypothetical protein
MSPIGRQMYEAVESSGLAARHSFQAALSAFRNELVAVVNCS